MSPADIIVEWRRCSGLRQADIDRLTGAGVDIMALAWGSDGFGLALSRDRVVLHPDGRRFEFQRYSRAAWDAVSAIVIVSHDREGEVHDLVAWRPDAFLASWLGRAAMLGAENMDQARIAEPGLRVHESPLDWLRNGREGVVVIDAKRAAADLRFAEPLIVSTTTFGAHLRDMLRAPPPKIMVDRRARLEAAE